MAEQTPWRYPESRLLVFAKAPQAGRVKTRLAASIGANEATHVYTLWLEALVDRLAAATLAPLELWVSPDARHPLFRRLAENSGVELHLQPDGDLGQRMYQVMRQTLAGHKQAVLIGSDCPVMSVDYVERALRALDQGIDTVIGPAEDGGYVLLGQNQVVPAMFTEIPWSTDRVMRTTRRRLIAARRYWAELETLWDIDSLDNYRRWQNFNQTDQEVNSQ